MRGPIGRRLLSLTLLLCLLAGCSPAGEDPAGSPASSQSAAADAQTAEALPFALAYDPQDSLHPYEAEGTLNLQLMNLLYDGLVRLDSEFYPEPRIADWIEVDGRTVTIALRSDVVFSDGSPLTADDVLYSLRGARAAGSAYAERLSGIASMEADELGRVILTLDEPNRYFASNLDIPIIKAGSDGEGQPVGSGRYRLIAEYVEPYLTVNTRWTLGDPPAIETVYLRETASQDTLQYHVRTGSVSYAAFEPSEEGAISSVSSATLPVVTNQLVFLGINSTRGLLAQPELRRAISGAIQREEVIAEGYDDRGWPAQTPFNPSFYALLEAEEVPAIASRSVAEQLLEALGYDQIGEDGIRRNAWGSTIDLAILVNEEGEQRVRAAEAIARQLRLCGLDATVERCSYSDYLTRIAEGDFDLYLGEMSLLADMDITPLLEGTTAAVGVTGQEDLIVRYETMREGSLSLSNFVDAFSRSMPFVPLCYRSGTVAYSRLITGDVTATAHDIYYNLEQWGYDEAD